jgi:PAS domain S-box-containing protein
MSREANIHILHVDDEPDFAELTAEFLKQEDDIFTITTATSAREGLTHLSNGEFDCIVSDYDMTGQNGIEFLGSVRERAPNLPFVLFTGKGSEEVAGEAISAGVTDYLQKNSGSDQYTVLANRLRNAVQRHRAEKDRKRQHKAIEAVQEGISILNEGGEYVYVNQAYADMYGYDPNEINGEDWKLTYPDDETEVVQDTVMPTIAEDGYWSGETVGLRADGTTFFEDHTIAQTETGELICSVRNRSVEQDQEVELTRFRTVVETLNDPVYVLGETGMFEYVNDAFVEMVGYDRETIVGASPTLIKSSEATDRLEANLGQILSPNGPDNVQFEIEVQPKRGEPIICEDHISVLPCEGEALGGSIGILRDITEQKEREQVLQKYQYAYESALDGEVTDVNSTFLDLWEYEDADDVVGRPAIDMWETPERAKSVLETITSQGRWEGELEAVRADGSTFYARGVNSHLTDNKGDPIGVVSSFFDITERKEREAELELQSAAIEAAMDGISILNEDGEYIYMNQAHADVFDYDADELLGNTWRQLYHDDEITRIEQDVFPVLERSGKWRGKTVGRRRNGAPVHQEITLSLLDDGKLICTNRDITERSEREQKLRTVSERFERFAGNVQDAFFLLSPDYSKTEYVNPAVELIYGITPEEAYDDPMVWLRHVHSDDKGELLANIKAQQDGTVDWPLEQEFRINHPDHGIQWVQARLNTIPDESGDPLQLAGVTTDITDRKQREESLNALLVITRELMNAQDKTAVAEQAIDAARSVLDQPISGLWLYDSDQEVLRPVAMTAQSAEVVGAPPTYAAGTSLSWEAFVANEFRAYDDIQTHPERLNPETPIRSELIIPLGKYGVINMGATEPANFSEADISIARLFGKTVEIALDRADREQQLLNQQSRLEQQNDRLDEFTGVVSHDLRNPLNVATGRLELAAEECDSDHLDHLEGALDRMEVLIDDLLTLARDGREVTDTQSVDLVTIANGCWENVETDQGHLVTTIDRKVRADTSRLKQVFENLFRNAIEHGRVDATVTIGELNDGFYIEDNGSGIPVDERDAVFNAGYSQPTDGTGFGLSIVEQIVNAHDWRIHLTDGTDGGARFEITNVEFVDR